MKYLFLFSFLLFQIIGFAQPKNQPLAVIAATKNNIVYRGVINPLSIAVPGYYDKDIVVKTNVGKIEHFANSANYELIIGMCPDISATVSVYLKKPNKKLQLVGEFQFQVKNLPKPILQLGSIVGDGVVSYERLNQANAIFAIQACFTACDMGYKIKEYHIKHKHKNGTVSIFKATDNLLTAEIKESFNKAEDGDVIMVYNIIVNGPNGAESVEDELILDIKKI